LLLIGLGEPSSDSKQQKKKKKKKDHIIITVYKAIKQRQGWTGKGLLTGLTRPAKLARMAASELISDAAIRFKLGRRATE
jgi:hypothetical protein